MESSTGTSADTFSVEQHPPVPDLLSVSFQQMSPARYVVVASGQVLLLQHHHWPSRTPSRVLPHCSSRKAKSEDFSLLAARAL